jgi:hypothetical protein
MWTLQTQMQNVETAWPFGGPYIYIEDVFSAYLYTGTGATRTITNNINLSTNGGLVWVKARNAARDHKWTDTARGATKGLVSDSSAGETTDTTGLTAFGTTGFTLGADSDYNNNLTIFGSWTFRKQKKFFDIVTYTGTTVAGLTVSHNLGSVPGCIIVKRTDTANGWYVYHRSLGVANTMRLDSTNAGTGFSDFTAVTSTTFTLSSNGTVNSAGPYVGYVFAHNAGGFGTSNAENVITCGSYSSNSAAAVSVSLGFEPQFIMVKNTTTAGGSWNMFDNMRGLPITGDDPILAANLNSTEAALVAASNAIGINATGFTVRAGITQVNSGTGDTYIYIAVRRGPMAVPTVGTTVFINNIGNDTTAQTTNFPVDMVWDANPAGSATNIAVLDRIRLRTLTTSGTSADAAGTTTGFSSNTSITPGTFGVASSIMNSFGRAPGFFDITYYTGNGGSGPFNVYHNLGVIPDLIITRSSTNTGQWWLQYPAVTAYPYRDVFLQTNGAQGVYGYPFSDGNWTSTYLFFNTLGSNIDPCINGATYMVYLFASAPGVCKVGSYTGTAALQTINCGFTGGARFVLIKSLTAAGDWYVYNSSSGIGSGNDPFMNTNNTSAQTTGTNYVDTTATGFQVTAAASATVNVTSTVYLFLAVA